MPTTVLELENAWNVKETETEGPTWDFMWEGLIEGSREKRMRETAVTVDDERLRLVSELDEQVGVAESAVKVR